MLGHIEWLFKLFDSNSDGNLTNEETVLLSEALLYMLSTDAADMDQVLHAMSSFMSRCFEFSDSQPASKPQPMDLISGEPPKAQSRTESAGLSLGAFRAVILSDPIFEHFMDKGMVSSFFAHLDKPTNSFVTTTLTSSPQVANTVSDLNAQRKQFLTNIMTSTRRFVNVKAKPLLKQASTKLQDTAAPLLVDLEPKLASNSSEHLSPVAPSLPPREQDLLGLDLITPSPITPSNDTYAALPPPFQRQPSWSSEDEDERQHDVLSEVDKLLNDLDMDVSPKQGSLESFVLDSTANSGLERKDSSMGLAADEEFDRFLKELETKQKQ
jgi:hypothetical protein